MDLFESLSSVVGGERVATDLETRAGYASDLSLLPPAMPQAVVFPRSSAEVQGLVRWAAATATPLIPVSSGPPRTKGDTLPSRGGVVVDLQGMNRIVRIDRKNRVALVEPGVTFAHLIPRLRDAGLRLNMPLLPRGAKSVLTSALEREPPMCPRYQWDASDPLCCVEVVYGTGELFWTGEAAGPGSLETQWERGGAQKFPLGPHQVDYHRILQGAQGTMGVVTWASIKCEQYPSKDELFLVPSEELGPLIRLAYSLMYRDVGDELFLVNGLDLACMVSEEPTRIRALADASRAWVLLVGLSGYDYLPEERIGYQREGLFELARQEGLGPREGLDGVDGRWLMKMLRGVSPEPYWKGRLKGACQDIFFLAPLDKAPAYLDLACRVLASASFPLADLGVYLQPMVQGTVCHVELSLCHEPLDGALRDRLKAVLDDTARALLEAGAFFSRPYPAWASMVYERQAVYTETLRKIKGIFDPSRILNPGKLCF